MKVIKRIKQTKSTFILCNSFKSQLIAALGFFSFDEHKIAIKPLVCGNILKNNWKSDFQH